VSKKSPNWGGVCLAVTATLGAVVSNDQNLWMALGRVT
jgi:hypothetical protein